MKNTIIAIILLFASQSILSQDFDFGKVAKEELEERFNPLDSSASATYLYKYRKSFFNYDSNYGFQLYTDVHERIKIYNQEGFDYATRTINLYKRGPDNEKLTGLKAYTYNMVDGKVEEVKLKKDGIFKEEKSKYLDQTKLTMPNIKEGSVIEYKYRVMSPFYSNVDEFVFQHDIPIKKLDSRFESPEYFNFKVNTKGYLMVTPKVENKRDKITFNTKTRRGGAGFSTTSSSYSSSNIEFTKTRTLYNLENVPALKDEPYVNNIDNYRSSVKYELSFTKFPQSPIKYYSTTWEDVVKTIYQSTSFTTELNKKGYYEDDVDALIAGVSNPLEKAGLIFNFVKSKVKWNDYYGKYTMKGVKKAYKEQTGNVAEINLMLTSMLRYAGLTSNPVLVSTRGNGIPIFPTREGYNYVISCIETNNGIVLLDASNEYSTPNVLPTRTLNWEGRIIRKNGSSALINLYPEKKSLNAISMMVTLDEEGTLEGGIRTSKTNHMAMSYRTRYLKTDKDQFLENLENRYDGMEISDFKVSNAENLNKPVLESYKFVKESQADIIGDKIYFSPLFFLKSDENPFKLEKREFPVDFVYPSKSTYRIIVNLPEGFAIESIPESSAVSLPDNLGVFKFNISGSGSKVQLLIDSEINVPVVSPVYYDTLKEFYKQMIEKENEQIVLTKA